MQERLKIHNCLVVDLIHDTHYPFTLIRFDRIKVMSRGISGSKEVVKFDVNHNYNKILKSDWLSTGLISALIGQFNRTVHVILK